ncbi:aldo/keto reductase [Pseudoflavonifractor phocaeensis]|uniref:aldo/keto reductase n=1 Tax=Pseudoflavonifractor phocaeensis TaxID=1870988 RepID=UPI0019592D6C
MERSCEADIFPYYMAHGIGVVPFSPIASGLLSGKVTRDTKFEDDDVQKFVPQLAEENLEASQPILDVVCQYAAVKGAPNAQIALAWMLHKYPILQTIRHSPWAENLPLCESVRFASVRSSVRSRLGPPKPKNPNLFAVGNGFGFFVSLHETA